MWLVRGAQAVNLDNVKHISVHDSNVHISFIDSETWGWAFENPETAVKAYMTYLKAIATSCVSGVVEAGE